MYFSSTVRISARIGVCLAAVLCLYSQENPTAPIREKAAAGGLPPHVTPLEYGSRAKVGDYVIGADFHGHAVPTTISALNNEDFVSVEVGLYGPKGAKLQISMSDFTLHIGKKRLNSVPYGMLLTNIKDPEYEAPEAIEAKKAKKEGGGGTSIGTGGGQAHDPPPIIHIPLEKQRAMAQQVQRASVPLGERELPVAGLIFFPYRGKTQNIDSIELIYNGPAGKLTLDLRPE